MSHTPTMKVHSGKCCLCDIGIAIKHKDSNGTPLFTGDIVLVYHVDYPGTDHETWSNTGRLTAVVADQYKSYSNGNIDFIKEHPTPYVMGIKGVGFDSPEWRIFRIKKFSDVVDGEKWSDCGFNYHVNVRADNAAALSRIGDA